jgi:AcrR family transcriptional regulator
MAVEKRRYDARRRRARAEEERAATRRKVVEAARKLFLEQGYVATTMSAISREAGVAMQSVYSAGKSKAELLHLVVDLAVAGDHDDVMLVDRPDFASVATETDARRQVEILAGLIASTLERLAPVWVAYREAAAVDASAAAYLDAAHRRRHETFAQLIRHIPEVHLREPWDASTETAWAIGSIDVFLLLQSRGWDAGRYARWLRDVLTTQLLSPT